jgi:hypothetical protein
MKCIVVAFTIMVALPAGVGSFTIHVPSEESTIQQGIDAASDGDTVLVADGVYTGPGNRDIDFGGKAITVLSENGFEATIIDCENAGRGFDFHSGETLESQLEGFTVTNGYSAGGGGIRCEFSSPSIVDCLLEGNESEYIGGGICCAVSHPHITGCTISYNVADEYGGGVYCDSYSYPRFSHCRISSNEVDFGRGAGVYGGSPEFTGCEIDGNNTIGAGFSGGLEADSLTMTDCSITDNWGWDGYGGINCITAILTRCVISGNATGDGYVGGISCSEGYIDNCTISGNSSSGGWATGGISCGSATLTECIISGNSAAHGGGIVCDDATIIQCIISDNEAYTAYGGGIWCQGDAAISNCIIVRNNTDAKGGGIYCRGSSPMITNCTISENSRSSEGGGGLHCGLNSSVTVTSCIMWNDIPEEIFIESGEPGITYSNIEGGWEGTGNIDDDPLFEDPVNDDFSLRIESPCIDSGDGAVQPPPLGGDRIDMGAREFLYTENSQMVLTFSDTPLDGKPGDTLVWNFSLENEAEYARIFDGWIEVSGPRTSVRDSIIAVRIPPYKHFPGKIRLHIPHATPPGLYTIKGRVGIMHDSIWDGEVFDCELIL